MQGEYIVIQFDDQIIEGVITDRQKFHIAVAITHPYIGWSETMNMPSFAKPNPRHYLTDRGNEVAKELLLTSYQKLKELDGRWEAIVKMRNELKHTLGEIMSKCSAESAKTAESVFQDYWKEFVFLNNEHALPDDQDFTLKLMIEVFNNTGKQLFRKPNLEYDYNL